MSSFASFCTSPATLEPHSAIFSLLPS